MELSRCPDGPLLDILCLVDSITALGRLSQTCKRVHSLITSNKDLVWRNACITWWRTHKPEWISESDLEVTQKYCERDWEWIARCFAGDEENSLSFEAGSEVVSMGEMREKELNGWGIAIGISTNVVNVGEFHDGREHGRGVEVWLDEGVVRRGEWREGMREGFMAITFDGGRMECSYSEDDIHGNAKIVMEDGFSCEGMVEEGLPKGK